MNHPSKRQHYALWMIWISMMILQHHVRGFLPVRRRHMMSCLSLVPQPQRAFTIGSRDEKNGLAAKHNKRSKNSQNEDDDQASILTEENAISTKKTLVSKQEDDDDIFYTSELIIKKSKFLAFACPTPSWTLAQEHLQTIHTLHPKARHVCFAFCGDGTERCSDDGEPTGTAGLPILNAIKQANDLDNVLVAVVRYFGGIKLGAGGLIRAYGSAARQVLQDAPTELHIAMSQFAIQVDISDMAVVYAMPSTMLQIVGPEQYDHNNQVCIPVSCPTSSVDQVQDKILDATRGQATFVKDNEDDASSS